MINGKSIFTYLCSIPNRKFECTLINRKDIPAYPHRVLNRKFEGMMIHRKYLLRGGAFPHE